MTQYLVLKDLAIIFAVSLAVILLFHRIKLPALPGFIVAGVLLGPNALGLVSDVVVAISDPTATRRMVRVARSLNARIHIIARTRYVVEIPELTRLGADVVIPEEFETSIEIFARVLAHYRVPRSDIERLVDQMRASHYAALRSGDGARRLSLGAVAGIPQMAVERLGVPPQSPLVGRSLAASGIRSQTGALVLSVTRAGKEVATPGPRFRIAASDILVVVGQPQQLLLAAKLVAGETAAATQQPAD
jgi:CPA2 family monovalent cation:H+ antiporter-2